MPHEFTLYLVRKLEINPSCLKRRFSLGIDANNNEQSFLVTLKFDITTENINKIVFMYGDPISKLPRQGQGEQGKMCKYIDELMLLDYHGHM
jgi:hypothetical protein